MLCTEATGMAALAMGFVYAHGTGRHYKVRSTSSTDGDYTGKLPVLNTITQASGMIAACSGEPRTDQTPLDNPNEHETPNFR